MNKQTNGLVWRKGAPLAVNLEQCLAALRQEADCDGRTHHKEWKDALNEVSGMSAANLGCARDYLQTMGLLTIRRGLGYTVDLETAITPEIVRAARGKLCKGERKVEVVTPPEGKLLQRVIVELDNQLQQLQSENDELRRKLSELTELEPAVADVITRRLPKYQGGR